MGLFHPVPRPVDPADALPGREHPVLADPAPHAVLGSSLTGPWPGAEVIHLALGCFWGAEKALWETPGVLATSAGYQGGYTANPTYREVCTGLTGHTETVRVAYDPTVLPTERLLQLFFELHDPTQGYRQGNDVGTQYRSAIYPTTPAQLTAATTARDRYAPALAAAGFGPVTTEIAPVAGTAAAAGGDGVGPFYLAEDEHQQYLHKVPNGYCPVHSTGVACPLPA